MINAHHHQILSLIKQYSGKATQHTFNDSYLGNPHPRYPISAPVLRRIAREWMQTHRHLTSEEVALLCLSLVKGISSTEKCMAGIILDETQVSQRQFDPAFFDEWLNHLVGWAEVDSVCTGAYTITEIPSRFKEWKKLLLAFSKSSNINKRRASLVLLCSPLRVEKNEPLANLAFIIINRLKHEKEILITKAVSWLLRSMVKHHRNLLRDFIRKNKVTLPPVALRETLIKLKTGKKSGKLK